VAIAAPEVQTVEIRGNYVNAIGLSSAASEGIVSARLIESRPTLRPAELLEFVPGVIVTQHSGEGKANQYFLRGFNLDHGTDFATFVDGMPVNMPTHAHGHGYSDLNWLIPELVERIKYRKGPYYAEEGDFSAAGSARISLFDRLSGGVAVATVGDHAYERTLLADALPLARGQLLYALEAAHNNGPWDHPERFHRLNGVLRYSRSDPEVHTSLTAMAYAAGWYASDQIPQRAVDEGLIGRFGAIDPSDGGRTSRYSLSFTQERTLDNGGLRFNAYAIRSNLDLFSDFTYFLDHPADLDPALPRGDQFEQTERRGVLGLAGRRHWALTLAGRDATAAFGLQLRHDRLDPVGLYRTVDRQRMATTQESRVRESSIGAYGELDVSWTPWLRSVVGLRADRFRFGVDSSIPENAGQRSAGLASPKLSLVLGPWQKTEIFINWGTGFHSNDARGTVAKVAPSDRSAIAPVDPLVKARGYETGVRTQIMPGLQSSMSLWRLRLASELVFSGDAGDIEPNRPSERHGLEWDSHYIANRWLQIDLNLAVSRARYTVHDPVGDAIPGAIDKVGSFGITVTDWGPWFGQFDLRYFGPRPLIEDGSQRSHSTTLAYLRIGRHLTHSARLSLDVFNLFDRRVHDIDYFYASRLESEPSSGVPDIHFHPVEPRSLRLTFHLDF
jgi:outer membrane receptor protein involved in Fe transport